VDEARGELLAAARLAEDVHRCLRARELADQLAHVHERRARAEELAVGRVDALGKRERRFDERAQLLEAHRLRHVVERAGLERCDRVVGAAVGGDHRHRHLLGQGADVAYEVEAVAVAEAHVGEAKLVMLVLQPLLRLGDRADGVDAQAHLRERELEELADMRLVVDHEHARGALRDASLGAPAHLAACRQRMRKCAPAPSFTYSSEARFAAQSSRAR
jgi:hypothetical protein